MQNSQKFPGFCPWTLLGRAYSAAPDSPAEQQFLSLLHSLKNKHPQKIARCGTVFIRVVGHLWDFLNFLKKLFFFVTKKNIHKKADKLCIKFSSHKIQVCRGPSMHYFKICCPSFLKNI